MKKKKKRRIGSGLPGDPERAPDSIRAGGSQPGESNRQVMLPRDPGAQRDAVKDAIITKAARADR